MGRRGRSGRAALAAAAVAAAALAGCGGSNSDDAKKVAGDFYAALRAGQGQKACALLTPEEAQSAAGAGGASGTGASCATTIGAIASGLPPAAVKSVKVTGDKATAELPAPGGLTITIQLEKRGGKWRVAHFS